MFLLIFGANDTTISDFASFISDRTAKILLTSFRILAIFGIGYWLIISTMKGGSKILLISISLIFAGALGNIIDSVFYGMIFNHSYGQKATIFAENNYSGLFYGKVVDMLHFPLFSGYFPNWMPFIGGDYFTFFNPVFNIADIAISTGVGLLLLYNSKNATSKHTLTQNDKSDLE